MAESGVAKDVPSVSFFSDIFKAYMICITLSSASEGNQANLFVDELISMSNNLQFRKIVIK